MPLLLESNLPGLELIRRGKVRDVYAVDPDRLLIVATDRISAFDVILGSGIPDKGRVLTQISLFWFQFLSGVPNHLITANVDEYPENLRQFRGQIEGRSMLVRRARMIDIECVARGYLSGSGWKEYQAHGAVCGIPLPPGLQESDRLPAPIFTPATKAQSGHDENISFEEAANSIGADLAAELRDQTLRIYARAAAYAETRGIILVTCEALGPWGPVEITVDNPTLTPLWVDIATGSTIVAGGKEWIVGLTAPFRMMRRFVSKG